MFPSKNQPVFGEKRTQRIVHLNGAIFGRQSQGFAGRQASIAQTAAGLVLSMDGRDVRENPHEKYGHHGDNSPNFFRKTHQLLGGSIKMGKIPQ